MASGEAGKGGRAKGEKSGEKEKESERAQAGGMCKRRSVANFFCLFAFPCMHNEA